MFHNSIHSYKKKSRGRGGFDPAAVDKGSVSLLPAFLLMVVVLGAPTSGCPFGASVLFGFLQELIQTERILLKLHRPIPAGAMVST